MPKKKKRTEYKKDIFNKVNLVFKNPLRVDIIKELSDKAQRPIDLAKNIGVQKQSINYHLNTLKKGGIVKVQKKILSKPGKIPEEFSTLRGLRVNGMDDNGKIQISYGVELTKNGERIAKQFVNQLYEDINDKSIKDKKF